MSAPTSSSDPLFAAMHAWRAAHPRATLAEMEDEATRQVAGLRRDLMAAVLTPDEDVGPAPCPTCGQPMRPNGSATRTVTTQQGHPLVVQDTRLRCSACGTELSPPR